MSDPFDTLSLLTISLRLLGVGLVLQSLELLVNERELRNDGLLGWRERRGRWFGSGGALRWLHASPMCSVLIAVRALAAATCLVLPFDAPAMPWILAVLTAAQAWHNHRFKMIHEGSDSMYLIGLFAMFAAAVDPADPRLRMAALGFFCGQLLLAYFAAGLDKVRAKAWRDGTLVMRALSDGAHRFEPIGNILARRPGLACGVSWGVILLELLFPLAVLVPHPGFWIFAALGIAFHGAVAVCMGLHGFFWSFVAGYPAVYFVASFLGGMLYRAG